MTCYEVFRALTLLGYQAEPFVVDVTLVDLDRGGKRIASVDNHVVLDALSFDRIVDPSLFLRHEVKRVAGPTTPTTPVVFQKSAAVHPAGNAVGRPPHGMLYDFSSSLPIADPAVGVDSLLEAERNALLTACQALTIMLAMSQIAPDRIALNPLLQEYVNQRHV
jgi:hypothetical protein